MVDADGKPFRTGSAFLKPLPVYNRLRSLQLIHPETDTLPTNELPSIELRLLVTFWLLLALLIGGTSAWWTVWLRFLQRGLDVNPYRQLRTAWIHPSEKLACGLAVLWTALHLWARFIPGTDMRPAEPTLFGLVQVIVLSGGTTMFLISLLLNRGWQFAADVGLKWSPLGEHVRDGWFGFKLAILPMACTTILTTPLRNHETQNVLLRLLSESLGLDVLAAILFLAIVVAPLSEELIFRVLLQGALGSVMPARVAIPFVAIVFAAVHGPVDGIALLPLALILGYSFDRRQSYLTVVVIHGLFNATMLALAMLSH